jgi:hypothetical protein
VSTLNVDKVDPSTGTALELGTSGDTITVPTGAGLTVVDEVKTNKISPATGTAFALGDSGDTFTVPSGATIVNSGTATGFGGGKILQVVSQNIGSAVTNNTSTYADTGVTVDITPSATSSKILVLATINGIVKNEGSSTSGLILLLLRDASGLSGAYSGWNGVSDTVYMSTVTYGYVDSPSSTSALTYKVQFKNNVNEAGVIINDGNADSSIVCMEIDGS